ncbi:DoxX family protein [Saccharospirillum salsuginis]|uniref:DoxX family membrane protein n=1 Tax=Saccharospirillum salsuginis TaxID=418750 RepID=A0A918K585_9GAMM|nr:hypothetical protein [Saccharospirillum salsuginis]GGX49927.1 hypothetical protein GCM10007392_16660 [Saccharospirillum salsuginis]
MITPIIILLILITPLVTAYAMTRGRGAAGHTTPDWSRNAAWGLGGSFLFFSLGHFVQTEGMVAMLPPWVPERFALVYLTGVLELAIGLALFLPAWQRRAAGVAIVVLVLFFPANLYAAVNATGLGGHQWGPVYLWIRAPLQLMLIGLAYGVFVSDSPDRSHQRAGLQGG